MLKLHNFLESNLPKILIVVIISLLAWIGTYYIRKVEAIEQRLWILEMHDPEANQTVKIVDTKFEERTRSLEKQIRDLSENMDKRFNALEALIRHLTTKEEANNVTESSLYGYTHYSGRR